MPYGSSLFQLVQKLKLSQPTRYEYIVDYALPRLALLAQVIRKMAESIQPPDPERFTWERHTSIIERSGFGQNVGGACKGGHGADVLGHHRASSCSSSGAGTESGGDASAMLSFWRVIAAAAEDPVPALPVLATAALREQARGGGHKMLRNGLLFLRSWFACYVLVQPQRTRNGWSCVFCVGSAEGVCPQSRFFWLEFA